MGSVLSTFTEAASSPDSHPTPPPVLTPILISPPSSHSHSTPSTQPPRARSSSSLSSSSSLPATRARSPFTSSRRLFITPRHTHTIMSSPITSSEPETERDEITSQSPELIARGKPASSMLVASTEFEQRASPAPSEPASIAASGTESPSPSIHDAAETPKGTMKCQYCDQPLIKEKLYGAGRFCNVTCCKAHAGRASSRAKHEKAAKRGKRRTTTTTTTSTKRIKHTNDVQQDIEMKQDTVSVSSTSAPTLPVVMSSSASALVTTSLPSLPSLSTTDFQLGDADTTGQALFQRATNLRSTIDTLTVTSQQHDTNIMNLQQELIAIQQRCATEQTAKQQMQTELASTQAAYQSMYQTCMTYQQSRASFLQIIQQVQQTLVDEEE